MQMEIYGAKGELWDRIRDQSEAGLREQGVGFTTQKGQLRWVCRLYNEAGAHVATCKRGVWTESTE